MAKPIWPVVSLGKADTAGSMLLAVTCASMESTAKPISKLVKPVSPSLLYTRTSLLRALPVSTTTASASNRMTWEGAAVMYVLLEL